MAKSINQVILMGNLTRDPELRQTPTGQNVTSFGLALNRSYKDQSGEWIEATDFIDCVCWANLAERVAQYLSKGSRCLVQGRLQYRAWEQDGQKRNKVEVLALDVTFLNGRGGGDGEGGGSSYSGGADPSSDSGQAASDASDSGAASAKDKPKPSKKPKKDDVIIEDIGDEPINLDDIPF